MNADDWVSTYCTVDDYGNDLYFYIETIPGFISQLCYQLRFLLTQGD